MRRICRSFRPWRASSTCFAPDAPASIKDKYRDVSKKGVDYLVSKQNADGSFDYFTASHVRYHFAGALETVILIPKKNGKTTLLAALALFHLARWPGAECIVVATARDQARVLFRQAANLVIRSKLQDVYDVKSGTGEIRLTGQQNGPRIRVMPGDPGTVDGVLPTLALVGIDLPAGGA